MVTKTDTIAPPSYDEAWTQSLNDLQEQMAIYETARRSGDEKAIEEEAPKVALAMRQVGDSHTDPKVKAVWYTKADKFLRSKGAARHGILQEVGSVMVTFLTLPFSLTCCMIGAVGHVIRGVGSGIVGEKNHIKSRTQTGKFFLRHALYFYLYRA
jgi:hypothetical protein